MKLRVHTSLALCVALLVAPLYPAVAATQQEDKEAFRQELIRFLDDLDGLSTFDEIKIAEARARVENLRTDELARLDESLSRFPAWRVLPRLASLAAQGEEALYRLTDARVELGELQQRLAARAAAGGAAGRLNHDEAAEIAAHFARVEQLYAEMTAGELAPLGEALHTAGVNVPGIVGSCDTDCGLDVVCWGAAVVCLLGQVDDLIAQIGSFVTDALNAVADVATELVGLVGEVGNFFVGLFNDIANAVSDLATFIADNFPTSPAEVASLIGLDDPDWYQPLVSSIPILEPPCPQMGSTIPGIGEVGSARAEWVCKRGIDWFAHLLYDLVPDDVLDIPAKIPATIAYYPINYFCLCMEAQSALSFSDAQALHRQHSSDRLDLALSTRATQVSANSLLSGLGGLDGDVAAATGQINVIDLKVDDLMVFQNDQREFLAAYQDLLVRINVEENLLENPSGTVALYEFPAAFGGFLEDVRDIVYDAIQANQAAGQPVFQAMQEWESGNAAMNQGDYENAFRHYRKAYTDAVKRGA